MSDPSVSVSETALSQREEALRQREEALAAREKQAALLGGLRARGLPEALSSLLAVPDDGGHDAGLDALKSALDDAVSSRVQDRLRRRPPAAAAPAVPDEALRRLRAAMGLKPA